MSVSGPAGPPIGRRGLVVSVVAMMAVVVPGGGSSYGSQRFATVVDHSRQVELRVPDASDVASLGSSVAMSADGTIAVVGSPSFDDQTGAAYVFARQGGGWHQTATLTGSDAAQGDYFGWSVAVTADGSTAFIGAVGHGDFAGAVYVFTSHGAAWSQAAELTASDGSPGDEFGYAVSLSSGAATVAIGAAMRNNAEGAAYVFDQQGGAWQQSAELTAIHGADRSYLGASVAVSADGSAVLAGAPGYLGGAGAGYLFGHAGSGWAQRQRLRSSDPGIGTEFGCSVSLSPDAAIVLIGAFGVHHSQGAVYVFARHGGSMAQDQELIPPGNPRRAGFGTSVALSSDGASALVGAPGEERQTGTAYLLRMRGGSWHRSGVLSASDGAPFDTFGAAVAISADGTTALAGSPDHDLTGATYVFSLTS